MQGEGSGEGGRQPRESVEGVRMWVAKGEPCSLVGVIHLEIQLRWKSLGLTHVRGDRGCLCFCPDQRPGKMEMGRKLGFQV